MNHTKDARRIGLVDVNGHNGFPNLALMRISAWHKARVIRSSGGTGCCLMTVSI